MAGYEQSITWSLLRPHLLQVGCPTSAPTTLWPDTLMWDLDPSTRRVALGWEAPGLRRLGRGCAAKGKTETRWVAYELYPTVVLVIEAWYTDRLWTTKATVVAPRDVRLVMVMWLDKCSRVPVTPSLFTDIPERQWAAEATAEPHPEDGHETEEAEPRNLPRRTRNCIAEPATGEAMAARKRCF